MVAFDRNGVDLIVLDENVLVLGDLVAAALLAGLDRLARDIVDELLAQPVAGLAVDLAERDTLARRGRGVERDRALDERELEVALPIGTRGCHRILLVQNATGATVTSERIESIALSLA